MVTGWPATVCTDTIGAVVVGALVVGAVVCRIRQHEMNSDRQTTKKTMFSKAQQTKGIHTEVEEEVMLDSGVAVTVTVEASGIELVVVLPCAGC